MPGTAVAQPSYTAEFAGAPIELDVQTYRDRQFANVIRQHTDFSCGSAALATLLTFHYNRPATEQDVFREMWAAGEQAKIRERGFSLLDMKKYLAARGLSADGYGLPLEKLEEVAVPAIALINADGYKHFVVVKGIRGERILLGDPSRGLIVMQKPEFEAMWDGTIFFIRSFPEMGREGWNRNRDWAAHPDGRPRDGYAMPGLSERNLYQTYPIDSVIGPLGSL